MIGDLIILTFVGKSDFARQGLSMTTLFYPANNNQLQRVVEYRIESALFDLVVINREDLAEQLQETGILEEVTM